MNTTSQSNQLGVASASDAQEIETMPLSASYNQLFSVDEALVRLGHNHQAGELLVLNNQESVQIFVDEGLVTHAHGAGLTGEAALKHALDLPASNFVWVAGAPPISKDLHIDIRDYLLRRSLTRDSFPEHTHAAQKRETLALPRQREQIPTDDQVATRDAGYYLISEKYSADKMVLNKQVNLLGREIYCDCVINDLRISRKHCLIQLTNHGVLVRDLGTINGTYINGKVIGDSYLNIHDKLSLGGYVLTLKRENPEASAPETNQRTLVNTH